MKLSDVIVDLLVRAGLTEVFAVTGGAVLHLVDSAMRRPGLKVVFNHHEQASALAAVAYSRASRNIGCAFLTTGPAGTNALTGLLAAWQDSVPVLFLSGQSRLATTSHGRRLRQAASQEFDIVTLVKPITKYAHMLTRAEDIRFHLEKALYLARSGRPGPVWLDIPLDLQWAEVDPTSLRAFTPPPPERPVFDLAPLQRGLQQARRPLVLAGYGVKAAGAEAALRSFLEKTGWPVVTTWGLADFLPAAHPQNLGRIGVNGQRGANLAVAASDFLLVLGSSLLPSLTGSRVEHFAEKAFKVWVNVDPDQLEHCPVPLDAAYVADAGLFLQALEAEPIPAPAWPPDRVEALQTLNRLDVSDNQTVDHYSFLQALSAALGPNDGVVVDGGGTTIYMSMAALEARRGQRIFFSTAIGAMGSGLPECVGVAGFFDRVVCLVGDGSLQFNVQELQTIRHHELPVKIFVAANGGYLAIRQSQDGFLEGRHYGSSVEGGLTLPDLRKIADAYGIPYYRLADREAVPGMIERVLAAPGPALCEVVIGRNVELPRLGYDQDEAGLHRPRPLSDMFPYLDRAIRASLLED